MTQKRIVWALAALFFAVADVTSYYGSEGILRVWMRNYGHDVLLPAFLYFLQRTVTVRQANRERWMAAYVACGCTAFEFAQLLGLYDGTFDLLDFIAYAAGIGAAVWLDRFLRRCYIPAPASN